MRECTTDTDDLVRAALDAGLDDWVMLHTVVWLGRDTAAVAAANSPDVVGALVARLVTDGLMVPGEIGESGFEAWQVPADAAIQRVLEQCEALEWNPLTDGCWFANTPRGDELAQAARASTS